MNTSAKHRSFVAEPIGKKLVTELPGIGEKLGERLTNQGFREASFVLGQFLILGQDQDLFVDWLKEICNANSKQATDCYNALRGWSDAFIS